MAMITKYVDTNLGTDDVSHGVGAGASAYRSLAYAESQNRQNLVTGGNEITFNCAGTAYDTVGVTFAAADWTTDTTHKIYLTGNLVMTQATPLRINTSYYCLARADADALIIEVANVVLDKMQIATSYATETPNIRTLNILSTGTGDVTVKNSIVLGINTCGIQDGANNTGNIIVYNCLIYKSGTNSTAEQYGIYHAVGGFNTQLYVVNCTIYGFTNGIYRNNGNTIIAINTICNNCTDGFNGTWNAASDYNASDIASDAPGAHSRNGTSGDVTFVSVTASSEDFHLASADVNAKGYGIVQTGIITDIDGDSRGSVGAACDIGVDEFAGYPIYSKQDIAALPGTDSDLSSIFASGDYTSVTSVDGNFVVQSSVDQYALFLFKNQSNSAGYMVNITWTGQSDRAPSASPVYLQIYNRNSSSWETLASNNSAAANTNFTLTGSKTTNLSNYYDAGKVIACRVYQQAV